MKIKEYSTYGITYEKRQYIMDIKVEINGEDKVIQYELVEDDNGSEISYMEKCKDNTLVEINLSMEMEEMLDEVVETNIRTVDRSGWVTL